MQSPIAILDCDLSPAPMTIPYNGTHRAGGTMPVILRGCSEIEQIDFTMSAHLTLGAQASRVPPPAHRTGLRARPPVLMRSAGGEILSEMLSRSAVGTSARSTGASSEAQWGLLLRPRQVRIPALTAWLQGNEQGSRTGSRRRQPINPERGQRHRGEPLEARSGRHSHMRAGPDPTATDQNRRSSE